MSKCTSIMKGTDAISLPLFFKFSPKNILDSTFLSDVYGFVYSILWFWLICRKQDTLPPYLT
jgi:hypothetical protein